ncbi:dynein regulatory complex subunit 7 isoform X3 [Osmia bicornis bicornis]|uniref:dynein regulatory complex subunit 7 isoform X3 n=1 Tax=Osmia bicornis bicornis TaxID=1437191 RepID=UPI001EAEE2FA|nr:dynein regulatory complex subunit 7 isoform X3 [Osmia bicornis bicornis]
MHEASRTLSLSSSVRELDFLGAHPSTDPAEALERTGCSPFDRSCSIFSSSRATRSAGSVVGKGRSDGEKDRCIRKQGASVLRRGWLAGWLARSLARRSAVLPFCRWLGFACTCEEKRTPRDRAGPTTYTPSYTDTSTAHLYALCTLSPSPKHLRSPTWVQKFQKGNCFECATFLTSLLLGRGYNAFVVSGYASREQTLCDLTRTTSPYLPQPEKHAPAQLQTEQLCRYELKLPTAYDSEFLLKLEQEEEQKLQEKLRLEEEEQRRLIEDLEQPSIDEYYGHRIHAWVVILPESGGLWDHEISSPLFIEPTTGVYYEATDGNTAQFYLGIESIWNDQNYWVNMQPSKSCIYIKWDLTKVELWEHLLPGEPWAMRGMGEEIDLDSIVSQEKHLDMPPSYVNEISISEQNYEKRYPNGMKKISYKKMKVELYAPYVQIDGLIQRITVYDDYEYITPAEVYEYYANRSDSLLECQKNLTNDSVVDYYGRGRIDQCKEHRYFGDGSNTVDTERIIDFYHIARYDGLSRIEMHPDYFTQYFIDRDDLLHYRHVEFSRERKTSLSDDIHYRQISKIIEKFNRNEKVEANKDVAIREFAIGDNEIRLSYHYNPGQYSRATRMFVKPPLPERGERLVLNPMMTQGYTPMDEHVRALDVFYELEKQLKEEDQTVSYVRSTEIEISFFLRTKNNEYLTPVLLISAYDKYREEESATDLPTSEWTRVQSQTDLEDMNYLKPYLARIGNPVEISTLHAYSIKYECLNDYKQLLVNRANRILSKFEEYTQELEKLQTSLVQSELSREEEEKILERMDEINFILQTLETRLNRHKDLVPKRYKMLMDHLQQNPYLTILELDL